MASPLAQSTKNLQAKYNIDPSAYGSNALMEGAYNTRKSSTSVQTNSNPGAFLGNIFNSIRNGVGAGAAGVGNVLKKTFYDEPAALGTAYGTKLMNMLTAPGQAKQANQNFRNVLDTATTNYKAGKLSFDDYSRIMRSQANSTLDQVRGGEAAINDFTRAMTHRDSEYNAKALPVALTAGSLLAPMIKPIAIGSNATKAGRVAQAGGNFVNDTFGFGKTFTSNPALQIAGKLARNELVVRPTVDSLVQAPQDINNLIHGKDVGNSALNLAGIGAQAILTGGQKLGKVASKFIGKNIFDTSGVFDIVKLKGNKSVNQALTALKSEAKTTKDAKILRQAKLTENKLRVLQDVLLQEANGNQRLAAQKLAEYQSSMNQFDNMELDQFLKEATQHFTARLAAQKIEKSGAIAEDVLKNRRVAIARLTEADRTTVVNAIKQSDDAVATVKALRKDGTIKNNNLYGQLLDIAKAKESNALKAERVQSITAANPLLLGGKTQEFGNGYFAMLSDKAIGTIKKVDETKQLITGNEAKLGKVGELLRKAGISPEEVTAEDNKFVFNKFKTEFLKRIDGIDGRTGSNIYDSLNKLADKAMGVTDIRQLSKRQISKELNLSLAEAGKIAKEAKDSYKVLSVAERGLAGKLMDFNLRVNPLAAPYSRVQSVARYEKNPFFRLQENIETRAGVAAMGGKQARPLTSQYDETIKKLNGENGIFSSGYAGEGADPFSGSFSGVKAKLSRDQEANIAATIEKFAGGPDKVDSWLRNPKNADLLNDFKTIVQYPDKGFTSSNMAKMMNLVAFPSRYNLKVTQFAVKQFMKQPAPVQISIIRGLKDFNDFTKTPEGIKWQADNKEALGLLSYFTPIQPIKSVFDTITGKNKSIGEIGMVGGLPFGVLTRILQGQGVLKDRVPYVDPKTGKIYSDRVPEDLKARAESLLNSIVDTLYTYPGRMAGMETSKKQATQGIVDNATFGTLKDGKYTQVDRGGDITPEQQQQVKVLKSLNPDNTINGRNLTGSVNTPAKKTVKTIISPPIYKKAKAKKGKRVKAPSTPISRLL